MSKRFGSRPLTTADILKAKEAMERASRCEECGERLEVHIVLDPHWRIRSCPACNKHVSQTRMSDLEVATWVRLSMGFDGTATNQWSDAEVIDLLREAFAEAERED